MTTMTGNHTSALRRHLRGAGLNLWFGGAITLTLVAVTLLSFVWTPYSPLKMNMRDQLQPPRPITCSEPTISAAMSSRC